jgi:hypothetical protein
MKIIGLTFAILFNFFFQSTLPSETSNQIIQTSKDEKEFSDEILLNTTRKLTQKIENKLEERKNIDSANEIKINVNSLEKSLLEIGYKEVNVALQESKDYFKRDITLPTQLPPVTFTHNFGRLNHSFGKENDEFEIAYMNDHVGQNHYQIRVRPVQYKLEISDEKIDHTIKLNDGSAAIYSTKLALDVLVFEKDKWQYTLLVDKKISNTVTKEVLVDIANSIK